MTALAVPGGKGGQSPFFSALRHFLLGDFLLQRRLAQHALQSGGLGAAAAGLEGRATG